MIPHSLRSAPSRLEKGRRGWKCPLRSTARSPWWQPAPRRHPEGPLCRQHRASAAPVTWDLARAPGALRQSRGRPQSPWMSCSRSHTGAHPYPCVMRFCRLPERGRQAFPWRPQRFSFPLPGSVTRAPGALSTRVLHFAHPCGSHPVQACPRPPVLGAGAAPRRGTGVCLWGEQEAATAVPLARPCVGTGCGGPNTPSPRLCPQLRNSGFVSVGLDLSFLRSQTWFCTYVSRI